MYPIQLCAKPVWALLTGEHAEHADDVNDGIEHEDQSSFAPSLHDAPERFPSASLCAIWKI